MDWLYIPRHTKGLFFIDIDIDILSGRGLWGLDGVGSG
jgi:hypothetical protein